MELLGRLPPAGRLALVGALTLVGLIVFGLLASFLSPPLIPLPLEDSLASKGGVLREWSSVESRGRYTPQGFEVVVTQRETSATAFPNAWYDWDTAAEVTVAFEPAAVPRGSNDPMPSVGLVCEGEDSADGSYAFRVGIDGRYAIFWYRGRGSGLLASNFTVGAPRLAITGPIRIKAECVRRKPTTLTLTVDGTVLLSVQDRDAPGWGKMGILAISADARTFKAVFRDLSIRGS